MPLDTDGADTDTLLAIVSSLLEPGDVPHTDTILEALVQANGNVVAAVDLLKSKKRKRFRLDDWFHRKSTTSRQVQPSMFIPTSHPPASSRGRLPPLLLSGPESVAQHTPCTLHLSVLPQELACQLFYTMLRASERWKKNRWYLFERLVESPHKTSFFVRDSVATESMHEAAQFWYNGRKTDPPDVFPPAMEEACKIVEDIVNEQLKHRARFPLEWAGTWRANVAASNCYEGSKESVGFHSDQLTYLGPCPTIASLSLGTQRIFSLREVVPTAEVDLRKAQTFNVYLPHNSLIIMHASCQENFKHSVPPQSTIDLYRPLFPEQPDMKIEPSNCRINITFRFYRPDFQPLNTPRCKCGVPTILRPDMKNRANEKISRYWWACYAGAQNEGECCNYWKVMDMKLEGRGPCISETPDSSIFDIALKEKTT